jgi:putative PEP-CTERM system TPR-repeat lipoprotein
MRKPLLFALPVIVLLAVAIGWWQFGHTRDPIAAAKQRMARGDNRGAALYLSQAVRAQPGNAQAAFLLGRADLALANAAAAQQEFERARSDGYDKAALVLPLGLAYLQQRHFAEVLRDFDPLAVPPAAKADALSLRATAQMSLHDLNAAQASATEAESLAPNDAQVLLTAARVALARGDLDTAADRAAKVARADPKPEPGQLGDSQLLLAEVALRHNDVGAALTLAQTVLHANPQRLDAKLMQARCLAATGREADAKKDVDAVLHAAPRDVPANFLRTMLAIHTGDFAAADASLQQIGPVLSDLPRGYYFQAVTKLGVGQVAQAEDAATLFLAKSPDDIGGLKLMAFIQLARQRPDRALAVLQTPALAAHPDADTLDLRGRALAMQGNLKGAKESFSEAEALAPQNTRILNRLAATELNLGQGQAGEATLRQSLALDPAQRLASEAMVQAALSRGDFAAAGAGVAQMRKSLGDGEAVGVLDAQVKLASLDIAGAEAELRQVLAKTPDSRAATLGLVRIDALKGDQTEAQSLLEATLRRHPTDVALLDALLPSLFATNQVDRAVKLAQMAHDAVPENPGVTAALAGAYLRAKQPDRAAGLLDRASAGSNADLDLLRGRILADEGKTAQASTAFEQIVDRAPANTIARLNLAALQVKQDDFDGARTTLHEGLTQSPGNLELMSALVEVDLKQAGNGPAGVKRALATAAALRAVPANMPAAALLAGNIYQRTGDQRDAAASFAAAYKTTPTGALAVKSATADAMLGNAPQGIALLEAATAAHPQDLAAQSVLSSLYLESGQLDKAASRLTQILALNQADVAALNNLAWIKQAQGDAAAAKTLAQRAYFQSDRPEIADTLGWILQRQGDTARALPLLKQATASADPSLRAAAEYHYAVALAAAGKRDEARSQVQSALADKAVFRERADAEKFETTLSQ